MKQFITYLIYGVIYIVFLPNISFSQSLAAIGLDLNAQALYSVEYSYSLNNTEQDNPYSEVYQLQKWVGGGKKVRESETEKCNNFLVAIGISENSGAFSNDGVICIGGNVTLIASGGSSYQWSTGSNLSVINVMPFFNTTYTVTATDNMGVSSTASTTIIVNSLPSPSIGVYETSGVPNDGVICVGASATLDANFSGGTLYFWNTGQVGPIIMVTPPSPDIYTVTVTNSGGCSSTATSTISVIQIPAPSIIVAENSGVINDGIICSGASATLTTSGGGSYLWNTNANGSSITVTPAITTTYTVTVTNTNGCTATVTKTIAVNQSPISTINVTENSGVPNDGIICSGASVTLTTSGGGSYLWNTNANGLSIVVTPLITTTYTVTVTNANGCTATATKLVTIGPSPDASINAIESSGITPNDGKICIGDSAYLIASGGNLFTWSNNSNENAISVSPTTPTTYTVTVSNGNGCSSTATRLITVFPDPTPLINVNENSGIPNDKIICVGSTATLTSSGGGIYTWSTGNNGSTITVMPMLTSTYTVTATDFNGCSATATITITVIQAPAPTITISESSGIANDGNICAGAEAVLIATGGTSYSWSNGQTTAEITVMPLATTNYTVTVSNPNGCTEILTKTISVAPIITVTDNSGTGPNDGIICTGATATLTASGGTAFIWSTGDTTSSIIVSTSGTYTVTVTNGNDCSGSISKTIVVNSLPIPIINVAENSGIANDGNICTGTSATLTASGGGLNAIYTWSTSQTGPSISVTPTITTVYSVTITNTNGCSAISTTTITVNQGPTPSIATSESSGAMNDGTVCPGSSVVLNASGGTSYLWSNGFSTASITVTPTSTTIYTVTVTNANGCSATTTKTIIAMPSINVNDNSGIALNDGIICSGASATLTAVGGTSYIWSTGQTTPSINVSIAGTYKVTVTNGNDCSATISNLITVNPLPIPSISVSDNSGITPNDGIICSGASATLTATGGGTYLWSNNQTNASITVTAVGTYTVTVTNVNGCTATSTRTITVNQLPTPSISVTENSGSSPNDGILCEGASATLTASGGTSYAWGTGQSGASISVNIPGTYTVTVTNANGCTATSSRLITVNALPTTAISITDNSGITPNDGIICSGASATLTASGGASYAWSNSQSGASITVSTAGNYTVTVTNANGCIKATSKTIVVNAIPTPSIAVTDNSGIVPNDGVLCEGATATLTASGGTSYTWSNSQSGTTITVTTAGTYTVTATNANACAAATTKTITVNQLPVPSIIIGDNSGIGQDDGIICTGANATLTASGGNSYTWSTSQTNASITVNTAGNYTVTVTNSNGCSKTISKTITVNPLPVPSISVMDNSSNTPNDGLICSGDNATLTGSGGTSYAWSTTEMSSAIIVSTAGTYTVTATNANGCSKTTTKTITVYPLPTPSIAVTDNTGIAQNDAIICAGDEATFTASGGASFAWNTSESSSSITVSTAGNYTVTITNSQLCSSATSRTLTVRPLPVPLISVSENSGNTPNDGKICSSDQVTLTASGGVNYAWENQNGVNPRIVFPTESTSYSVTATNANNCSAGTSTAVTVFDNPTAGYSEGANFNPTLNGFLTFNDNSTQGSGQITNWNWSFLPNGDPASLSYTTNQSASTIPNAIGDMTVKLTVIDANKCSNMQSDVFYIGASNSCTVNSITLPPLPACEGGTVLLNSNVTLSSGLTNNIVWHWDFGGGAPISGENTPTPIVKFDTPGTYIISVSFDQYNSANPNDPPCTSNTYTKTIVVNANPIGTLSTSTPVICEGESIKLNLGISDTNPSPSGYTVSISGIGAIVNVYNGQEIIVNSPPIGMHVYVLQSVKNSTTGCESTTPLSVTATVNQNPKIQAVTDCNPQNQTWKATLILAGKSPYTLVINGESPTIVASPLYTLADIALSTNNLVISISDANGCSGIYTIPKPLCDCPNPGPISMNVDTYEICEGTASFKVNSVLGVTNPSDQAVLYEIVDPQTNAVKGSKSLIQFNIEPEFTVPPDINFDKKYIVRATVAKNNGLGQPDPADACKIITLDSNTVIYFRKRPDAAITTIPVCVGNTFNITVEPPGNQYNWSRDGQPLPAFQETLSLPNISAADFGSYAVTVTDAKGCTSESSIVIDNDDLKNNPVPFITGEVTPCNNEYEVVYQTNSLSTNNFNWQISGGEILYQTGNSVSVHWTTSGANSIAVTETNSEGCFGAQTYSVTVSNEQAPNIALVAYAPDLQLLVCTDNSANCCYQWGTSDSDGQNPVPDSTENNQAWNLAPSGVGNPDDHSKLFWVDIWYANTCGPWKDAQCRTRCYYWKQSATHDLHENLFKLTVFPNPAVSQVTLSFLSENRLDQAELMVFNVDGRKMKWETFDIPSGSSVHHLSVSNFSPGVYILQLRDPQTGKIQRKSLVVQHN